MDQKTCRLFFGLEIQTPWPFFWPKGKWIEKNHRHVTLNFLGNTELDPVKKALSKFPLPPWDFGPCGFFDKCLELPENHPRVIAWHIQWFDGKVPPLQQSIAQWLKQEHLPSNQEPWLSHLTVCRNPENSLEWKDSFEPLPCYASALHLYESLGNSQYQSLWSRTFLKPFEEIEHTADIAFLIYGENIHQIYKHAVLSLCFKFPKMIAYANWKLDPPNLDEIVIELNALILRTDCQEGCPFKAVSFHGRIETFEKKFMQWEMIVDV